MTRNMWAAFLCVLVLLANVAYADDPAVVKARELFSRYDKLGHAFHPTLANCYSDEAVIVADRVYPDGQKKTMTFTGRQWKKMFLPALPVAKAAGDIDDFSNVSYAKVNNNVRVTATRYNRRKKYSSPYTATLGPDATGKWVILREHVVTRP